MTQIKRSSTAFSPSIDLLGRETEKSNVVRVRHRNTSGSPAGPDSDPARSELKPPGTEITNRVCALPILDDHHLVDRRARDLFWSLPQVYHPCGSRGNEPSFKNDRRSRLLIPWPVQINAVHGALDRCSCKDFPFSDEADTACLKADVHRTQNKRSEIAINLLASMGVFTRPNAVLPHSFPALEDTRRL